MTAQLDPYGAFEWFDDAVVDGGALEIHEAVTTPAPGLELALQRSRDGHLVAYWVTDSGSVVTSPQSALHNQPNAEPRRLWFAPGAAPLDIGCLRRQERADPQTRVSPCASGRRA